MSKDELDVEEKKAKTPRRKKKEKKKNRISEWFNKYFSDPDEDEETIEIPKRKPVKESPKRFTTFEFVFVVFLTFIFGIVGGCFITIGTRSVLGYRVDDEVSSFVSVYNYVKDNYYEDVDDKKLMKAAIAGMLNSLGDEYTYFMDESSTDNFNTTVNGTYNGIGITIQSQDKVNKIISIFKGSPADKEKMMVGDIILKVNGEDVTEKDSSYIAGLITNKLGEKVKITIKRGEKELDFTLKVSKIDIPSVSSEVKEQNDKKIGYIKIDNFAANTSGQFKTELKKVEKEKIDSLIIDVRDNTGGALSQVHSILEMFFDKKTVLYQIETKGKKQKFYSKTEESREYPVVVLTNSLSASASEVLASCFKENYKDATIIGTTTYGKGTVQKALDYKDGTSFKFTSQKWLTPKGHWIHKKGVKPDVEVKNEVEDKDQQLQTAIDTLAK
ncbi:MAG: S41 family peptidase [Bacilli bacterium]|nr:S41 family peptidase [Bacilli bacterium]